MKVLEKNTPEVFSFGNHCDENGYSYEWINGQNPHLIQNRIRIPYNTENFVFIVIPGLSSSPSGSSSTSKTPSRQVSHSSPSSSLSSSPTVSEIQTREREDQTELTSLQYLCQVRLMIDQGDLMIHKPIKPKTKSKENTDRTERPVNF